MIPVLLTLTPTAIGWNNTEPTATQFTVGTYSDLNTSGGTYLAYLFDNLDGICKIGEYWNW